MSPLPLIDVEKHFNDPSIPDGTNVGFVNPHGVVHDAQGRAIGIDHKHENAKNPDVLERLRRLIEGGMEASAQLGKSAPTERRIEQQWSVDGFTIALDNLREVWVYGGRDYQWYDGWVKAKPVAVVPPLPQGA